MESRRSCSSHITSVNVSDDIVDDITKGVLDIAVYGIWYINFLQQFVRLQCPQEISIRRLPCHV